MPDFDASEEPQALPATGQNPACAAVGAVPQKRSIVILQHAQIAPRDASQASPAGGGAGASS